MSWLSLISEHANFRGFTLWHIDNKTRWQANMKTQHGGWQTGYGVTPAAACRELWELISGKPRAENDNDQIDLEDLV